MFRVRKRGQSLRQLVDAANVSQRVIADTVGVSESAFSLLINKGVIPKRSWPGIRERLIICLEDRKTPRSVIEEAIGSIEHLNNRGKTAERAIHEEENMLLRKHSLTQAARKHFNIRRNPFDDPQSLSEVYLSSSARNVRERMNELVDTSSILAVIGESGAGKTTLKEEFIGRMQRGSKKVLFVEPYVLAMAENTRDGIPLRISHITDAFLVALGQSKFFHLNSERRFQMLHKALDDSYQGGHSHILIIEEAHDLHWHTLKALKRFWDMKSGMKRLVSILFIGQTEFGRRIENAGAANREVAQRCDIVTLEPLNDISDFLASRFKCAGLDYTKFFTPEAVEAVREKLTVARGRDGKSIGLHYPLAIANLVTAAMNNAAEIGETQVSAEIVRRVGA